MSGQQHYGFDISGNPCGPCPPVDTYQRDEYEDYSHLGSTRLEDTDLFARSINVSEARDVDEDPERPANFRKKVTRRVEVPYTRKVKVPVRTTKIVPSTQEVKVPVKKLVQVPCYKVVDEEYTVFEEHEAVREKEIWVKQVVPEKYMQRVPVKMTRQVKKPSHEIQEVEELVSVQVPSTKAVEVDGYRIDDVEDTKVVEVEEFQEFEYIPKPTGDAELARTREMGRVPNSRLGRNIGSEVYREDSLDLRGLDLDSNPPIERTSDGYRGYGSSNRGSSNSDNDSAAFQKRNPFEPDFSTDNFTHTDYIRPAGKNLKMQATNAEQVAKASQGLGVSVRNTHTRHSNGTGVLVTRVEQASRAAMAGLQEGDMVTTVNGRKVTTVEEFAREVKAAGDRLQLHYNRDGRRNLFANFD